MKIQSQFPYRGQFMIVAILACSALLAACGPDYKKFVPPPPQPVSYSGAAPDPDWIQKQTQTYKDQGAADAQAELTARMEYEREASGQKGSVVPFVSEVISSTNPKKVKGDKSKSKTPDYNPLSALPTPPPGQTPSPTPQPLPTPKVIIDSSPYIPRDNTPITPIPTVPTDQPGVPQHPGE